MMEQRNTKRNLRWTDLPRWAVLMLIGVALLLGWPNDTGRPEAAAVSLIPLLGQGSDPQSHPVIAAIPLGPGIGREIQMACSTTISPPPTSARPMSYDAGRSLVVLYVGSATWEYDGTAWQPVATTRVPRLDKGAVMAYDQARGLSVLAGLRDNYYQETWEYDGLDWTPVTPTVPYPPWVYGAMVADSGRGRLVFFGGMKCAKPGCAYFDATYEYTGTTWAQVSTAHAPAPRASFGMAYDAARGVTVLFGGGGYSGVFSDTWEYDGTDWQLVTPTVSPPARGAHALAYDANRGVVVLFGGLAGEMEFEDTWEYDGTTWRLATPPLSPSARGYHAMVYDAAREVVVLYGGYIPGHYFGDTWEYDGATWGLVTRCNLYLPCVFRNP